MQDNKSHHNNQSNSNKKIDGKYDKLYSRTSVSYTHLDVYKRQTMDATKID